MKKTILIALAMIMVLSLAACSQKAADSQATSDSQTTEEENIGLANPWSDADTKEAAAEGAGVGSLTLPEDRTEVTGGPINWISYRYMDQLAEANGAVGAAELTVRKGVKGEDADVSGDYTEYKYEWEIQAAGTQITCYGNEDGKTMKAIWFSEDYSYAILVRGQGDVRDTYGLSSEDINALVGMIE